MKSIVHEVYISYMRYIVEEQKEASARQYSQGFIRKKPCNDSFINYKSKHRQNQVQGCRENGQHIGTN